MNKGIISNSSDFVCVCVGDGCRHWERYCSALDSRTQWASKLLQDFQKKLESSGFPPPPPEPREPNTQPLGKTKKKIHSDKDRTENSNMWCMFLLIGEMTPIGLCLLGDGESVTNSDESLALKKLRSSCMVIRVDDLDIHQVSVTKTHTLTRRHRFHLKMVKKKKSNISGEPWWHTCLQGFRIWSPTPL